MTRDGDGAPEDITIAAGFAGTPALRVLRDGVNVPASALPQLRDALNTIDQERPVRGA